MSALVAALPLALAVLDGGQRPADVTIRAGDSVTLLVSPAPRVTIAAGTFRMGATAEDLQAARTLCGAEMRAGGALLLELAPRCGSRFDSEVPQAEVFLPSYEIDRTEVTVEAYRACVRAGICRSAAALRLDHGLPHRAVEAVTFSEAAAFCRWKRGRLPSEAEWEKAARGPGRRRWPWGDRWDPGRANHGKPQPLSAGESGGDDRDGDAPTEAAPVGIFSHGVSPYGAQDMAGNVWEWTSGYFSREPPQASVRFDPRGPMGGDERTIRGGAYRSPPSDLRLTRRVGMAPSERRMGVGFRCAYDPVAP